MCYNHRIHSLASSFYFKGQIFHKWSSKKDLWKTSEIEKHFSLQACHHFSCHAIIFLSRLKLYLWMKCSVLSKNSWILTDTWPLIMTSSEKRTLTGLDFNLAFFAALIKADLGDWKKRWWQDISRNFKLKPFFLFQLFPPFLLCRELCAYSNILHTEEWKYSQTIMHPEVIYMYMHIRKHQIILNIMKIIPLLDWSSEKGSQCTHKFL